MSLINQAAEMFLQNTASGNNLDTDTVSSALQNLLPNNSGDLDLGSLTSSLGEGGLMTAVNSWLGDGANNAVDGSAILGALGGEQVSAFAQALGMDEDTASSGLANMLPNLINDNSSGGSLLDAVGGVGGLADMAKKFL